MHLVALLEYPAPLDAAVARLAHIADLSPYEARTRIQGDPPRIAAVVAEYGPAEDLALALSDAGFASAVVPAASIERDADRHILTTLAFGRDQLDATLRDGSIRTIRYADLALVIQGVRLTATSVTEETNTRKFSAARAVLTGGLVMNKTVAKTTTHVAETREAFLYFYEAGRSPALALYERRTHYGFLGASLQPSAAANFATVVAEVRKRAPDARFDARLVRPTSLGTLPLAPGNSDPGAWKTDVAAALIALRA
jgi:hypothetical protein